MFPGEQNLPVENQGLEGVQGSSLAPTLGAETEASNMAQHIPSLWKG